MQPIAGLLIAVLFAILLMVGWDKQPLVWWSIAFVGAMVSLFAFVGRFEGDAA